MSSINNQSAIQMSYQRLAASAVTATQAVHTTTSGQVQPAITNLRSMPFDGIALKSATTGQPVFVSAHGPLDPNIFNLGDGYVCAVGTTAAGFPVRATDPTCVSAPNWLGHCDVHGNVTIAPVTKTSFLVDDYGAIGDGIIDDKLSIDAAINDAGTDVGGGIVEFGPRTYLYDGSNLTIVKPLQLIGTSKVGGTVLKMGAGRGVIFDVGSSYSQVRSLSIYSADNYNFTFVQPNVGTPLLKIRHAITVDHVYLQGGLGHGVELEGNNGGFPGLSKIIHTDVYGCGGHGFWIHGGEASNCTIDSPSAVACGGWGVLDDGFLGNWIVNPHTEANRLGAYRMSNLAAQGTLMQAYSEGDQAPSWILSPNIIIGGDHGAGIAGYNSKPMPGRPGNPAWQANHAYVQGDSVTDASVPGKTFRCAYNKTQGWPNGFTPGTSGSSAPAWNSTAEDITQDQDLTWETLDETPDNGPARFDGSNANSGPRSYQWGDLNEYKFGIGNSQSLSDAWRAWTDADPWGITFGADPYLFPGRWGMWWASSAYHLGLTFQGQNPVQPASLRLPPPGAVSVPNGLYLGLGAGGADERLIQYSPSPPTRGVEGDMIRNTRPNLGAYIGKEYWIIKTTGASDGYTFASGNFFRAGDIVRPTTPDTFVYECTVQGTTSGEPTWTSGTVTSGTASFRRFGTDFTDSRLALFTTRELPDAPTLPILSGITLRLRGDLGVTLQTDAVATWADQSGSAYNEVQATPANQPNWTGATINSRQAISFDGATSKLIGAAGWLSIVPDNSDYTIFVVIQPNTTASATTSYLLPGVVADNNGNFQISAFTNTLRAYHWDGAEKKADVTVTNGQNYRWRIRSDGTNLIANVNGGSDTTTAAGHKVSGGNASVIGANYAANVYSQGLIGEIIIFNRVLSTIEETQVQNYLTAYWGF